ncbi:hypothetical protein [Sandaracinus amylolyticus]|uniref:Uncharacterized protein n=1 Tax=Sandaracinus amylolyticus TaxID=927083 RepID=A0A0F6YIL7_9BACT|nr:hypothetical protein [Sandaracinus amylolyticus]AKF06263.1 hypothetical protein DB32_003412 [Sandaracinus amylolyticus]
MKRDRLPTPVVLAASSSMIVIGVLAWMVARDRAEQAPVETTQRAPQAAELHIDDRTPEAVAESFYDAWRRRAWDEAERIAVGEARARVHEKQARDAQLDAQEREMAREAWLALAGAPLTMFFQQSDTLEPDQRIALRGIAGYDVMSQPYRREVEFEVVREGERWRVERMVPGRVLTDVPDLLKLADE